MSFRLPLIWIATLLAVLSCSELNEPTNPTIAEDPLTGPGSLRIELGEVPRTEDTLEPYTYEVVLDDSSFGIWELPHTFTEIPAGPHTLVVFNDIFSSRVMDVAVAPEQETTVRIPTLIKRGLVGSLAPPFTVTEIGGGTISLEALRGKVVVLAFFGSTG